MDEDQHVEGGANDRKTIAHYCDLLKSIYESLPADSEERDALEFAAKALLFSMPQQAYHAFLSTDELTQQQKDHLSSLGLDLDENEPESTD